MPTFNSSHSDYAVLAERYEDFVGSSPYGTFMQSVGWAQVKNNWDADYVYVEDEAGNIKAAMSLLSISNDGGRSSFTYGPGAPVCDFSDRELVEELIAEAEPVLQDRHSFVLRLGSFELWNQELVDIWRASSYIMRSSESARGSFTNPQLVMVLDLDKIDEEDPMISFPASVRNKIRKGEKNGVATRFVTVDSPDYRDVLDKFYQLIETMAERQGIPHRPYDYYDRMMHAFPQARLWITEHVSGKALAGSLGVTYNRAASDVYEASSNDMRQTRPSFQMNYEAIAQAKRDGVDIYDMGGIYTADLSDGLYNFKERICGPDGVREYVGELDVVRNQEKYHEFMAKWM
ncbi:lipid II:glycine glycyltransferase FemX [Arcanobacterium buesumense]|uniref:Aminoacyltransferase n=1 Tax=Arcanobacterium buesumense TaxID=2722751 RepID=A0A6H2EKP2_9ACTO|nr:peptidoglycan bridge formation glycyltransferase FemA/FemB family protein [Arcanobacterium buesumense]QJC21421.1 aminoacyltransferase [Arcanobacterium buesumense]